MGGIAPFHEGRKLGRAYSKAADRGEAEPKQVGMPKSKWRRPSSRHCQAEELQEAAESGEQS